MRPDAASPEQAVAAAIERVRSRLRLRAALTASIVPIGAAAAAIAAVRWNGSATSSVLFTIVAAAAVGWWLLVRRTRISPASTALAIERAVPSDNVIVTAEELQRMPERSPSWIRARVAADAARRLDAIDTAAVVPLTRPLTWSAVLVALVLAASLVPARMLRLPEGIADLRLGAGGNGAPRVQLHLVPPAYSGLAERTIDAAERVEALEGTRLAVRIDTAGPAWRVRFGTRALTGSGAGPIAATMELTESGYLAIEPAAGAEGESRLIAVDVTPDRAPTVTVERPARDLLLPTSRGSVEVAASATDDLGLERLSLRYTKVSGSGEQFEFQEGELPVDLSRGSARSWRARAAIPIEKLGLEPGDSLVYRVTAADRRGGDKGSATSETYFIEIAGPGQVALEGVEMPPEQERYALSQQMIVVKILRLREREKKLAAAAVQEETAAIAAEQRSVRANFVFLMGGHVEDEEEEAEHSNEIQEGRLENTARREISIAVSHMGGAEQGLVAQDTTVALQRARLAVEALQRAFGRNRYLLRALPSRSRIDPSRRLTGALDEAADSTRISAARAEETSVATARALIPAMLAVAGRSDAALRSAATAGELTGIAERALGASAAEPSRPGWQQIAQQVLAIRAALPGTTRAELDRSIGQVLAGLSALARTGQDPASGRIGHERDRLRGAWSIGASK